MIQLRVLPCAAAPSAPATAARTRPCHAALHPTAQDCEARERDAGGARRAHRGVDTHALVRTRSAATSSSRVRGIPPRCSAHLAAGDASANFRKRKNISCIHICVHGYFRRSAQAAWREQLRGSPPAPGQVPGGHAADGVLLDPVSARRQPRAACSLLRAALRRRTSRAAAASDARHALRHARSLPRVARAARRAPRCRDQPTGTAQVLRAGRGQRDRHGR